MSYQHRSDRAGAPGWTPWWVPQPAQSRDSERTRVSNDERQEAIDALITHWSAGRLDEPTFDQRAARARAAVTRADLQGLFFDLPALHPTSAPAVPDHHDRRPHRLGWLRMIVVVCLVLWALGGIAGAFFHPHVPWLLVGVLAWVVVASARRRRPV